MPSPTRRTFLKSSAASAAGLAAFGVPAVNALGANEKLNIGVIGSGNRGSTIFRESLKQGHNIVALCDIAEFRQEKAADFVVKAGKPKPQFVHDYRQLLDRKDIDAVIIATPDHHHHDVLVAAVAAGKDAYCEKPLSHTIEEGRAMVAAVRKTDRIVQVGNQRHSGPHWARAREVIQSADFGKLVWVKVWDCRTWVKRDPFAPPAGFDGSGKGVDWKAFLGKAPDRPFDPVRYWSWRWYWDYAGGLMTDIGAHQLDIVQWLGGAEKGPRSVTANGGNYYFKHWETPDVVNGVWDYGTFTATFAVEFINGADGVGAAFYGTKQTLIADADAEIRLYETVDKIKPEMKPKASWKVDNETPAHVGNWLECCKSRKPPHSTIELGHRVITAAHLANLSYRTGKRVSWDAEREELVADGR
jgi:predicted dehydrogenase